ncbi:MAG: hypothetical protein NZ932_03985 [Candidatus Bathyarchaeota archaeon]|nr:hypothetical protein [Candidatus Bathyarchaeota archaeon]MDW8022371.1 hypothetical protein [Nitrososphaerota archaeon]
MKLNPPDLIALSEQGFSVYGTVLSPQKVVVKRQSFPKGKGKIPPHLAPFKGQNAKVAKACAGRKGQAYVQCLRQKSIELGTAK